MRVKIADSWFDVTPNMPIMIELTAQDKANITAMKPGCTRYAAFHGEDPTNPDQRSAWMDAGAGGVIDRGRRRRR